MISGFKQFILRGNVIDLAVAVVIGGAFGAVVDFSALVLRINGSEFLIGDFLNAVISFVLIAAAVYFAIVVPVNAINARRNRGEAPPDPTTKKCPECLSEIAIAARRCAFCTSALV